MKRTESPSPTARQNLYTSVFQTAQAMLATYPSISPEDAAVAFLAVGYSLAVDPAVTEPATARKMLTDLLADFDAGTPAAVPH